MNGKKKLLIVNNNLSIGGVQRSLINLLKVIKDTYDVTLFLFSNSGEYIACIPTQVKILEAAPFLRLLGLSQAQTKKYGYMHYYIRSAFALYSKIFSNHLPISLLISTQKKLSGFDVAISFLNNEFERLMYGGCNEFVLRKVDARVKISFLHNDFLNYGGNTYQNRKVYELFDKIAIVSEGCRKGFIKAVPELAEKTHCVYNCHSYSEYILKGNDDPIEYSKDCLNIITIARLGAEKGILRGIDVMNRLVEEGNKIRWHIVGDGIQRKEIENKILNSKASKYIFLYGNQENPYRYLKNADILLLPSFHEAAPMVFDEAKCLGIPIVTTNTSSAKEMVDEGKEGFVCQNSEKGIYEVLKTILENPNGLNECREHLVKQRYTNEKALLQFISLIEGGSG